MKRRILLIVAGPFAALALSGCAGLAGLMASAPPPPAAVADKTVLDEQLLTAFELGYKAWRIGVEALVDMGRIKGAKATQMADLDKKLYGALAVSEHAYKTLNASSYKSAIDSGNKLLAEAIAFMGAAMAPQIGGTP